MINNDKQSHKRYDAAYLVAHQRPKKVRDQGSQPRDLESQPVESGSTVFFIESEMRRTQSDWPLF